MPSFLLASNFVYLYGEGITLSLAFLNWHSPVVSTSSTTCEKSRHHQTQSSRLALPSSAEELNFVQVMGFFFLYIYIYQYTPFFIGLVRTTLLQVNPFHSFSHSSATAYSIHRFIRSSTDILSANLGILFPQIWSFLFSLALTEMRQLWDDGSYSPTLWKKKKLLKGDVYLLTLKICILISGCQLPREFDIDNVQFNGFLSDLCQVGNLLLVFDAWNRLCGFSLEG